LKPHIGRCRRKSSFLWIVDCGTLVASFFLGNIVLLFVKETAMLALALILAAAEYSLLYLLLGGGLFGAFMIYLLARAMGK
jgi:hypothetical protein